VRGSSPTGSVAKMCETFTQRLFQRKPPLVETRSGALETAGIIPAQIVHVFPIIASLQDIPLSPLLRGWISERLEQEGYLQDRVLGDMRSMSWRF
jgi:hypothetical protein